MCGILQATLTLYPISFKGDSYAVGLKKSKNVFYIFENINYLKMHIFLKFYFKIRKNNKVTGYFRKRVR